MNTRLHAPYRPRRLPFARIVPVRYDAERTRWVEIVPTRKAGQWKVRRWAK